MFVMSRTRYKRDRWQKKINKSQERLDRARVQSAQDLRRNKIEEIKSTTIKILAGLFALMIIILFLKG